MMQRFRTSGTHPDPGALSSGSTDDLLFSVPRQNPPNNDRQVVAALFSLAHNLLVRTTNTHPRREKKVPPTYNLFYATRQLLVHERIIVYSVTHMAL